MPHARHSHALSLPLGIVHSHRQRQRSGRVLSNAEVGAVRDWLRGGKRPDMDVVERARQWEDQNGLGFLHMAARKDWTAGVDRLLEAGFSPQQGPYGLSPAWLARSATMVERLADEGKNGTWHPPEGKKIGTHAHHLLHRHWSHAIQVAPSEEVFAQWLVWPEVLCAPLLKNLGPRKSDGQKRTKTDGTVMGLLLQKVLDWDRSGVRAAPGVGPWIDNPAHHPRALELLVAACTPSGMVRTDGLTLEALAAHLLSGKTETLTSSRLIPGSLFCMKTEEDDPRPHPVVGLVAALLANGLSPDARWPGEEGGCWISALERFLPACGNQGRALLSTLVRARLDGGIGDGARHRRGRI